MPQYEVILLCEPALAEEAVDGETNQVRELITRLGGSVQDVQKWGKKRLAYEIGRRREGHYVFLKVEAPTKMVAELERYCRISESVMRVLTVKADPRASAPPPPPRRRPEGAVPAEPVA